MSLLAIAGFGLILFVGFFTGRKDIAPLPTSSSRGCSPLILVMVVGVIACMIIWPIVSSSPLFKGMSAAFQSHVTSPQTAQATAPSMVLSPSDYVALARQDAQDAGIDPQLFVNQMQTESHFNPNAQGRQGEIGIAQFMPETARGLGIDPHDPVASLKGAAQLMARYVSKYGDYAKALAVYNAGPGALQSAITQGGANWKAFLPLSTQQYISTILG